MANSIDLFPSAQQAEKDQLYSQSTSTLHALAVPLSWENSHSFTLYRVFCFLARSSEVVPFPGDEYERKVSFKISSSC